MGVDTVLDTTTALTWQRNPPTAVVTWMNAVGACQALTLNGMGWRLPTVKELQSLMNVRAPGVAIDTVAFPNTPEGPFWTSLAESASWVWVVESTGSTRSVAASSFGHLRCVR